MKSVNTQAKQNSAADALIGSWHDQAAVEGVKTAIRRDAEEDSREFASFEAFFNWYDVLTGYGQMDEEESIEGHKEILKVAYAELVAEGFFTENASIDTVHGKSPMQTVPITEIEVYRATLAACVQAEASDQHQLAQVLRAWVDGSPFQGCPACYGRAPWRNEPACKACNGDGFVPDSN